VHQARDLHERLCSSQDFVGGVGWSQYRGRWTRSGDESSTSIDPGYVACSSCSSWICSGRNGHGRLPKLDFPMFAGDDPQIWKSRCEKYFQMYEVESSMWIKVASMHLEGAAARWF
jgi:hypothetical protein